MTEFKDLGLAEPILAAVTAEGYTTPTPIQAGAIPHLLEGSDLLGIAQTGTGKTASFALPILHRLANSPGRAAPKTVRILVLTPTRELAAQINDSFGTYGRNIRVRRSVITGGVGFGNQVKTLSQGVEILTATPGRLLDLVAQGHVKLDRVETFVLDEADRMLDMGFVRDVRKIAQMLPVRRQTVLFSATMPDEIASLASSLLHDPKKVEVTPPASTAERIEQRVMFVSRDDKRDLLVDLLSGKNVSRAIVFTRTKHGANRVAEQLMKSGVKADAIHGNKSQNARQRALDDFKAGRLRALVATDIAARGIDVDGVTHVINYELPNEPDSYVHRIGRTARAGADGVALSMCDQDEVAYLRQIEKTIRRPVPIDVEHNWHADAIAHLHTSGAKVKAPVRQQRGQRPPQGQPAGQRSAQARPAAAGQPQAHQGQKQGHGSRPHQAHGGSGRPAGGAGRPGGKPGGQRSSSR